MVVVLRLILVFVLAALAVPSTDAQTRRPARRAPQPAASPAPPAAGANSRASVRDLRVEGNVLHPDNAVLSLISLKTGQVAGKPEFDAAQQQLVDSGLFDNVRYRYGPTADGTAYAVTYTVTEAAQRFPMRVEALPVNELEARRWLTENEPLFPRQSPPTLPGTPPALARYRDALQRLVATRDPNETVTAQVTAEGPGQVVVLFRSSRAVPTIAEVRFTGNKVIPTTALQNAVAAPAIGTPYREERFREVLALNIQPLYDNRGHLRVRFGELATAPAADVKGLVVTVPIEEGPVYTLQQVTVRGMPGDPQALTKQAAFPVERTFDQSELSLAVGRLTRELRRRGHLRVESKQDRTIDDAKKTASVTVTIAPGPLFNMGELRIEGLDIQSEPVIRQLWARKPGEPFDVEYPDFFLQQVRERGIFERLGKTEARTALNDQTRTVDVTLVFGKPDPAPPPPKQY